MNIYIYILTVFDDIIHSTFFTKKSQKYLPIIKMKLRYQIVDSNLSKPSLIPYQNIKYNGDGLICYEIQCVL